MSPADTPAVALTIAGSDSGAGAGLQADLKAMAAAGVFGTTVVTAVTAQNTKAVTAVHPVPLEVIDAQLDAIFDDFAVGATKTGLLGRVEVIELVARRAERGDFTNLVVDPVAVASSGTLFLDEHGLDAYREKLLPQALLVTPNLWEASILSGTPVEELDSPDAMVEVARAIRGFGSTWVLVKGGHLPGVDRHRPGVAPDDVRDVLVGPGVTELLDASWIDTRNNHGTGCSLAASTAAHLALGHDVPVAVRRAKQFVHRALLGARDWSLGVGHGPLDPFGWGNGPDGSSVLDD